MKPIMTLLALAFLTTLTVADDKAPAVSFQVPYRLSDVKHVVIRVKINGQGPFNFIVDTGAPAVYFGSDIAKKLGKEIKEEGYWDTFDTVEIEGGLKMNKLKVRVEEPFQLVGINKMNAAGIRYHGVMGYSVLAQYQIEYDFTKPHLKWTKLDWTPPSPVAMGSLSAGASANMKAMIGLSSFATALMPKKEDAQIVHRGLIGIEVEDKDNAVVVTKVLPNTPAAQAGIKTGDQITACSDKAVKKMAELQKTLMTMPFDTEVTFVVERSGEKQTIKLTTGRGF